ncbi:MAG TPA: sigma-70 family RNA polymerase sigma factor [Polyangiaceae bacterium]|nr:sigma-70 family RNA polymerase sigma factor [Polyangiaceae bacterium]
MVLSLTRRTVLAPLEDEQPLAFEAIYAQHFRGVWRTLRRLGVSDAQLDDAAQDVFVVVHRRLNEFDGRSLRSWLYAIAVRVASDYRRGAAYRQTTPLRDSIADAAPDPAHRSELNESVRLLHALLAELDEPKRVVFVLSELEQLSVPEIAEILSENLNTIYSRQRAARSRFEAALKRHRERTTRRPR